MTSTIRDQLQATLGSAYTLERELGGGGMSRVFVAEETALKRKVVVKVLPPELTAGVNVERFNREILLAAKLQHPHIVPVLTAGETNGLPYYTMPLVEGESLRAKLARSGAPSIADTVGILRDVAKALAYAHERGIVHRDIKPDNVLVTGGSATVTDFGIAKAISASRTQGAGETLTQIGTSIGTPTYMSPEQAAGDPDTDHRADIYSFGCMAYELLAGRPPFVESAPRKLLAAHMGDKPKPVTDFRPDAPPALADLVMRCLAKEADDRPQHASDLVHAIDMVTSSGGSQALPSVLLGGAGMFRKALAIYAGAFVVVAVVAKAAIVGIGLPDWVFPGSLVVMALGLPVILWTGYVQRVTRRAMAQTPTYTPGGSPSTSAHGTIATMALKAAPHVSWYKTARGGMYAFGTFIALVAVFMAMRAFGIGPFGSLIGAGKLGAGETLVVADFRGPATDSTLGGTVAEALRTDLGQSSALNVMTRAAVRENLRLMQRPAETPITFDVAREIATREGAKAVLDGEIVKLGSNYVVSARLVSSIDGSELAKFRQTADGEDAIVSALGRLSRDVRDKVGESLKNIHDTKPLERVSTASLPALRKYVEGNRLIDEQGDLDKGLSMLEEAVALDSTFAMAWRKIAVTMTILGNNQARQMSSIATAYRHRDHLTDTERLLTEAYYFSYGPTPDREKAIAAYETVIEADSSNTNALNNISILYGQKRDLERAERATRRAVREKRAPSQAFTNLYSIQLRRGEAAAAESTAALFQMRLPNFAGLWEASFSVRSARGDLAGADSVARATYSKAKSTQASQRAALALGATAYQRGQAREGLRWGTESIGTVYRRTHAPQLLLQMAIDSARYAALYLGNRDLAGKIIRSAMARTPMAQIPAAQRPWNGLVQLAALSRDATLARDAVDGFARDLPSMGSLSPEGDRARMRGFASIAAGRYDDAVTNLRQADRTFAINDRLAMQALAQSFDLAGKPDSAIAYFEKYAASWDLGGGQDQHFRAGTYKRLGELYEAKGDVAKAAENYRKFIDLWKNADPELQPKVAEVRNRLAKLAPVEKPRQ